MDRGGRFGRFLVTALPLTALWGIVCPFAFSGSTVQVVLLALMGGWLACVWVGAVAAGWIPAPPARPQAGRPYDPHWERQRAWQEHQHHLWEQARAAYLNDIPGQQPPPPTDNFPGF